MRDTNLASSDTLKKQGIWYQPYPENFTKATAMIKGPPGTPYADSLFFFSFEFPMDYPFSPPKVLILTGDGKTRMHPNLYVGGKVCLSILGTYSGPSWSANMTIETVLINLQSLLDENPLANEPAYGNGKLSDPRHKDYAEAVEHQVIAYMAYLLSSVQEKKGGYWTPFTEEIESLHDETVKNLLERCSTKSETFWDNLIYGMNIQSQWGRLKERFQSMNRNP